MTTIETIRINLDPNFTPFGVSEYLIYENGQLESKVRNPETFEFPSGCEPNVKMPSIPKKSHVMITCRIKNLNDFFKVLLAKDALDRMKVKNVDLFIPFLPFARQDRVMVEGEALSLKVIADIINNAKFENVYVVDAHSNATALLINNCTYYPNYTFVKNVLKDKENYLLVSPDEGAYKKFFDLCKYLNYTGEVVQCSKIRELSTGKIKSMKVPEMDFGGKDLYIIDDIIDGGGTFIGIAEQLKKHNCGKIYLVATHGILSKGLDVFKDFEHIYCTNSFKDHPKHPKLTQLEI